MFTTAPFGPFQPSYSDPTWRGASSDPSASPQATSVTGNIGSIPQIQQLTELINQINQRAQQAANAGRIPNGAALEDQSSNNIGAALRGEVGADERYNIARAAAERGVGTGSPAGANANADYLRALGLSQRDVMNQGQNWLTQATGRNPAAPIFDPSTLLITPAQQAQIDLENERLRIARLAALRPYAHQGGGGSGAGFGAGGSGTRTGGGLPLIVPGASQPSAVNLHPSTTSNPYLDQLNSDFDAVDWTGYSPFGETPTGTTGAYDYNWDDFSNYG